jgi:plasmid stabilization system protein ParE
MPRGDKSRYTDRQKRQAEHIEEGYESRGVSHDEAERRAWATLNKETHGGKKSGPGRDKEEDHSPSRKGGRLGGAASAKRPAAERSQSAKKASRTRRRRAAQFTKTKLMRSISVKTYGRGNEGRQGHQIVGTPRPPAPKCEPAFFVIAA